jgi:hypothetical protein
MSLPTDFSQPTLCKAIGFASATAKSSPMEITRRACGDNDVVIEIKYV